MSEEQAKKLTPNDPVPAEVLGQFNQLQEARQSLAVRVLDLEQQKIRLLTAAHEVDQQQQRLFEQVLMERGISPTTPVEIDSNSGMVKVLDGKPQQSQEDSE